MLVFQLLQVMITGVLLLTISILTVETSVMRPLVFPAIVAKVGRVLLSGVLSSLILLITAATHLLARDGIVVWAI